MMNWSSDSSCIQLMCRDIMWRESNTGREANSNLHSSFNYQMNPTTDNQVIRLGIIFFSFQKWSKFWFQLLKRDYFLASLHLHNIRMNIFGLWTKQDIWGCHLVLREMLIDTFHCFHWWNNVSIIQENDRQINWQWKLKLAAALQ